MPSRVRSIPATAEMRDKVLQFTFTFPWAVFLDSCGYTDDAFAKYEWIAAGSSAQHSAAWYSAKDFSRSPQGWKFGLLTYDARHYTEPNLPAQLQATIPFPEVFVFEPEWVIARRKGSSEIEIFGEAHPEKTEIQNKKFNITFHESFRANVGREAYRERIARIREHIRQGDFYEMNFCREFSASAELDEPLALWQELIRLSPMPFSALVRKENTWLMCASPERFLQKRGRQLITQPIKGTVKSQEGMSDARLQQWLQNSEKDKAENVMITDLSRNDLNRSCIPGSVKVSSLFEVRKYPGLFHMHSTIEGELKPDADPMQALFDVFPPGSMTGAPKVRVMELTEAIEASARGMYSGVAGYFDPDGNFDLNVIIRSLVWDAERKKISFHSGGAITWDSDAEAEFEETQTKAQAIFRLLGMERES